MEICCIELEIFSGYKTSKDVKQGSNRYAGKDISFNGYIERLY